MNIKELRDAGGMPAEALRAYQERVMTEQKVLDEARQADIRI